MKKILFLIAVLAVSCTSAVESPRVVEDFNFDWKFMLADGRNYAYVSLDDSDWRELHLPHDWAIEGEFSKDNPSGINGGALPGGTGWYRKTFPTPESVSKGKKVFVEFDGVFMNSTVYVNGTEAGSRPYGYSSFSYDITDLLNEVGKDNLIAVKCDNSCQPNSRWYSGCGIYRNVRLVQTEAQHIAYNGVYVTTPIIASDKACVKVSIETEGCNDATALICTIVDRNGREVASANAAKKADGLYEATADVPSPHLWDLNDCYMYTARITVSSDNAVKDIYEQKFGFRTAVFDTDKGFLLNGKQVKLQGVCLHHDMGCIGSAIHYRALERELGIMKEMGCNAIRTSHNPPAPEFLEICDKMGFIVMDEAFDMWRKKKVAYDYSLYFDEWHERDLRDFIRRDRNHPCIALWSIGNEIMEQMTNDNDWMVDLTPEEANIQINFMGERSQKEGLEDNPNILLTRHLAEVVRNMDPTRQVTAGNNWVDPRNNLLRSGALDVYGLNYHHSDYDKCRHWFPEKAIIASETISSVNSRGTFMQPSTKVENVPGSGNWLDEKPDHQLNSYDCCKVPWGSLHEEGWIAVRDREWVAGTFVWTGFDYLGEPTPFPWTSRSSYFGIVDLAGFPKDSYYFYQSEWRSDKTVLHLLPHWNWKAGDKVDVWCYYNNADEVELFLNGKSIGKKSKTDSKLHAEWLAIPWEAGEIRAVSYKGGKEVARDSRKTAGEIADLKLSADRDCIKCDGYDLCYITVQAVDSEGNEVPLANDMMKFKLEGVGELFGVDNGNAADTYCLKGNEKALFNGKALAVIRSEKNRKGTSTLTVSSDRISKSISIKIK